jgi:hypothetical protein
MFVVLMWAPSFDDYNRTAMLIWILVVVITFAVIFAINSSIHSYLVVKYAKSDKVAVSVGFYYMSNACGRLLGTLGSGLLYTYVGEDFGPLAGSDAVAGMAACFLAGTVCSVISTIITFWLDDHEHGLKCGACLTLVKSTAVNQDDDEEEKVEEEAVAGGVEDENNIIDDWSEHLSEYSA